MADFLDNVPTIGNYSIQIDDPSIFFNHPFLGHGSADAYLHQSLCDRQEGYTWTGYKHIQATFTKQFHKMAAPNSPFFKLFLAVHKSLVKPATICPQVSFQSTFSSAESKEAWGEKTSAALTCRSNFYKWDRCLCRNISENTAKCAVTFLFISSSARTAKRSQVSETPQFAIVQSN